MRENADVGDIVGDAVVGRRVGPLVEGAPVVPGKTDGKMVGWGVGIKDEGMFVDGRGVGT